MILSQAQRGPCIQMSLQRGRLHRAQNGVQVTRMSSLPPRKEYQQEEDALTPGPDPTLIIRCLHAVPSAPSCQAPQAGAPAGRVGPCDQLFSPSVEPCPGSHLLWNLSQPQLSPVGPAHKAPTVSTLREFGLAVETHNESFLKDDAI